ncbi:MAG: hypothetical protein IPM96_16570 [Ignavibacteria bacterium]|nr:hypothetical protein [Ignavibacteria bacterium]
MAFESDKTMFEIYREKEFNRKFKVVYYTELTEHNKEFEINSALNGETIFDGFLKDGKKEPGKAAVKDILREMNSGDIKYSPEEIKNRLKEFLA